MANAINPLSQQAEILPAFGGIYSDNSTMLTVRGYPDYLPMTNAMPYVNMNYGIIGEDTHFILIEEPGEYEIHYSFGFNAAQCGDSCFEVYAALDETEAIPGGSVCIHTGGAATLSQRDEWVSNHFYASLRPGDHVSLMIKTVGPYTLQTHFSMPHMTVKRVFGPPGVCAGNMQ